MEIKEFKNRKKFQKDAISFNLKKAEREKRVYIFCYSR